MNRKKFFDAIRRDLFKKLTESQVEGCEAILDGWERRGLKDLRHLAYMLATAYHETARTMQPIKEFGSRTYFMKMYDKSGDRRKVAATLGNTVVGDGATFCGRGFVQLTGRANYRKASDKLGVDFISAPDKVMVPANAAEIMFAGMGEGWFTGKKLSDYLNGEKTDWRNARRIINGLDKADSIAGYGKSFYTALLAADDGTASRPEPPRPDPAEWAPEDFGAPVERKPDDPGPEPVPEPLDAPIASGRLWGAVAAIGAGLAALAAYFLR